MKKEITVLLLCALFLLADWFCFWQTIDFRHLLSRFSFGLILSLEILAALILFGISFLMLRKITGKQPESGKRSEVFQPFRRLFLSFWSLRLARR